MSRLVRGRQRGSYRWVCAGRVCGPCAGSKRGWLRREIGGLEARSICSSGVDIWGGETVRTKIFHVPEAATPIILEQALTSRLVCRLLGRDLCGLERRERARGKAWAVRRRCRGIRSRLGRGNFRRNVRWPIARLVRGLLCGWHRRLCRRLLRRRVSGLNKLIGYFDVYNSLCTSISLCINCSLEF